MKWFRLWNDILDDHKINQLNDYEFRLFIYLLACASEEDAVNGRLTRTLPAINRRCRRRQDHFNRAVETFQKLDLITVDQEGYITITKWNKRQFQSDRSYDRVKKHREQQPIRNVSVTVNETPPDTDTDTDTEKDKSIIPSKKKRGDEYDQDFMTFWSAYPKKAKKPNAYREWKKLGSKRPSVGIILAAIAEHATWRSWIDGFIPDPERWLKSERWADEKPPDGGNGNGRSSRLPPAPREITQPPEWRGIDLSELSPEEQARCLSRHG
ncbi:MAG: hypothetical protein WAZ60_23750 [Desulfosalsimonadaceae bacterium]